ncbi:MAG: hypothetical protein ACLFVO_02160, partial [Chloroflexaceae bacterium]
PKLRGVAYFGPLTDANVSFACGSMVRFYLFHKNLHKVQIFVKKMVSSTLPEATCPSRFVTA